MKLGQMMSGGDRGTRQADDFYAAPEEATLALLEAEHDYIDNYGMIWEPACGDGAICEVLKKTDRAFIATDIKDRGYADQDHTVDFLGTKSKRANAIITNPPFTLATPFIEKAHSLGVGYMALLLKSTFWHASSRIKLFETYPPARLYPLTWRLDFRNLGRPTMECMWCVWDEMTFGLTSYHLLPRL